MAGRWEDIDAYLTAAGCRFGPGSTVRPGDPGFHGTGQARDYGDANSDVQCVWNALEPLAQGPNYVIQELFWKDMGWDNGSWIGKVDDNHGDHVHAAIRSGASMPGVDAGAFGLAGWPNPIEPFTDAIGGAFGGLGDLPGALIEAVLGMPVREFALRVCEVFGGAVLMSVGMVMILRVLTRGSDAAGGVRSATRTVVRPIRKVTH